MATDEDEKSTENQLTVHLNKIKERFEQRWFLNKDFGTKNTRDPKNNINIKPGETYPIKEIHVDKCFKEIESIVTRKPKSIDLAIYQNEYKNYLYLFELLTRIGYKKVSKQVNSIGNFFKSNKPQKTVLEISSDAGLSDDLEYTIYYHMTQLNDSIAVLHEKLDSCIEYSNKLDNTFLQLDGEMVKLIKRFETEYNVNNKEFDNTFDCFQKWDEMIHILYHKCVLYIGMRRYMMQITAINRKAIGNWHCYFCGSGNSFIERTYSCKECGKGINPYYYAISNQIDINECDESFSLINKEFGLINHSRSKDYVKFLLLINVVV